MGFALVFEEGSATSRTAVIVANGDLLAEAAAPANQGFSAQSAKVERPDNRWNQQVMHGLHCSRSRSENPPMAGLSFRRLPQTAPFPRVSLSASGSAAVRCLSAATTPSNRWSGKTPLGRQHPSSPRRLPLPSGSPRITRKPPPCRKRSPLQKWPPSPTPVAQNRCRRHAHTERGADHPRRSPAAWPKSRMS